MNKSVLRLLTRGVLLGALCCVFCMPSSAEAKGKTKGFVVTWFGIGHYKGENDCPDGLSLKTEKEKVLSAFPAAERARLLLPQNFGVLIKKLAQRGPEGINVCEHPDMVVDAPMRTVQGKIAYGLDLDGVGSGAKTKNTCSHPDFSGVDGDANVDNQFYRVFGCAFGFRTDGIGGYITRYQNSVMRDGNFTLLIEISGIDDENNDDDVQVGLYNGADAMVKDAGGNAILSGASLTIADDTHYHNLVRGKIVGGVLTTEPADINIKVSDNQMKPDFQFRSGRIKLSFDKNGEAKGVVAGYLDWRQQLNNYSRLGSFGEESVGFTCPSFYKALKDNADGYPDPKTGECTAISSAYIIEAIPAFVIHPKTDVSEATKPQRMSQAESAN